MLVDYGADFDCEDYIGRRPLHFAIIRKHYSIIKYLLEQKANPWSNRFKMADILKDKDRITIELIGKARKLDILLKMTPVEERDSVWEKNNKL